MRGGQEEHFKLIRVVRNKIIHFVSIFGGSHLNSTFEIWPEALTSCDD